MDGSGSGSGVVPHAGSTVLLRTAQAVGLTTAPSAALTPWRKPLARHDPGKVVTDLAVSLAIGGDCLADLAQLRAAPEVFGSVASDPTVSRLVDTLAADAPAALAAINIARAAARERAWSLAGKYAPDHRASAASPVVIDVDATLVTAHSEKEFLLSLFNAGLLPAAGAPIVFGVALSYGGAMQVLAGMWEFRTGNVFGATAFTSYGAFWLSFWAFVTFYAADIPGADDRAIAVGWYLIGWGIFTVIMWVASLRTTAVLTVLFTLLAATFFVLGCGDVAQNEGVVKVWRLSGPGHRRRRLVRLPGQGQCVHLRTHGPAQPVLVQAVTLHGRA